jgi:hypothetical protein
MRNTSPANDSAEPHNGQDAAEGTNGGKGRATPTRKEREAANKRPLVSNDRKAANKESRAKVAESRERARLGMANGEEKYLVTRDKGPQRRYIRDYIDARFSIGEVMIPIMFIVIILTFINDYVFQFIAIVALWVFFLLAILDCVIVGYILNRKVAAKFGEENVQRGNRWYAAMRALQLRPMRLPKPQVKRRQYPA